MRTDYYHLVVFVLLASLLPGCRGSSTEPKRSEARVWRIAIIQQGKHPILEEVVSGCRRRLGELYADRVTIDTRNGGGNEAALRHEALEVVSGGYDVIVPIASPATLAVLAVSDGRTPIVFSFVTYPPAIGYSGPGSLKNVTGIINGTGYEGTLDALQALVPKASRIGYLISSEPNARHILTVFEDKARARGLQFVTANIESGGDIPQAARSIAGTVDCFLVGGDHTLVKNIDPLLDVADLFGRPIFAVDEGSVQKGALAAATINYSKLGVRTGEYVAFVLSGVDANRMAPETYDDFELVVNTKACERFGVPLAGELLKTAKTVP